MKDFLQAALIVTLVSGLASIPLGLFCAYIAINPPRWMQWWRR